MFYRTPENIISIPRNIVAIPTILRHYLEISIPRNMKPNFIFCCCRFCVGEHDVHLTNVMVYIRIPSHFQSNGQ